MKKTLRPVLKNGSTKLLKLEMQMDGMLPEYKLIKKVRSHVPEDLNSAIQHAKRYEMAIEEVNCTKLVNLTIGETSSAAEEKIDQLAKKVKNYFTNQQQQQPQRYQPPQKQNQNNFISSSNNQSQICHYSYYLPRSQYQNNYYQPAPQPIQQQYQQPLTQHYQIPAQRLIPQNQFTSQNQYQPRSTHYHTQPSYLIIPKEQDFHHTAFSESRAATQQQNPSYISTTIPPARIAEKANLSDIFPFKFEANELPFLLSNAAANEQKAITAMYTEAKVEGKPIHLILDSGSAGSIITYQLMQQLKRNVDQPAQTIIVTTDGMKKTPVREIDNFSFTIDGITIPVKVLVMDAPQYQALVKNNWLQKANANLNWETQELTIPYQKQHARVPAICDTFNKHSEKAPAFEFEPEEEKPIIKTFMALGLMSNWAEETEQKHFTSHSEPETPEWNIPYSKPEPRKQHPYILLKCKDCHKKLLSMKACISPKEEYENHLIKRSRKWDRTPCLTCGKQLPDECDWIDVAFRGGVCDQTCQYAFSIAEKVKCGTPFNAAYNSTLSKLYYYSHDAEMIYKLAMVLINGETKEDVLQMKEAKYIEYTLELTGFDYEDEVKVYHQIASHTYSIQEAQIQ
ncbi:hypothetical protein G9A89_002547 [Geosiphon pyriformis]|nr:hypothetical protein G9A89_002547 [Geosiphon pyriformis]